MARTMGAAEFKAHCLEVLDGLDDEGIVITKRGKPIALLVPVTHGPRALIGALRGRIGIEGDLGSTGARWNASRRR